MNDELTQLAIKYKSDRHPGSKHSYTPYYYNLFSARRKEIKKVLEIGVGEGRGLRMWKDFFPNAFMYGAENMPERVFSEERIEIIPCDQAKKEDLLELLLKIGTDIDIVIDDASHKSEDQVSTCLTLMPHLKRDVIYIIEDVADPTIVSQLTKYNIEVPELRPKKSRYDDRLVVVRHKNEVEEDLRKLEVVKYRRVWEPFLRKYKCGYVCEVGVDEGGSFVHLIAHNPKLAVAVDPWIDDGVLSRNESELSQEELDRKYAAFKELMADKPFVHIMRDYSTVAAENFPDNYFDFVYIDADHTYEASYADILAWYPKVKPGKFLAGHDYLRDFGVYDAVNKFIKDNDLRVIFLRHSNWIVVKK